jgi:hypothetical protein
VAESLQVGLFAFPIVYLFAPVAALLPDAYLSATAWP